MICGRRCAICWLSIRWLPSCCSPQPGVEDLEEARSFLQTMDQSAQRMAAMFDGLLQLNRAQRHVLQPQPVDLLALLGGLRQRLQAARKADIEWCLPAAAPMLQADPHLLEQALTQLSPMPSSSRAPCRWRAFRSMCSATGKAAAASR
jgi:signal transduction histidine kinase